MKPIMPLSALLIAATLACSWSGMPAAPTVVFAPIESAAVTPPTADSTPPESVLLPTAAIPESPLSPGAPWALVRAHDGLWAVNPDGSGLTQVYTSVGIANVAIAPHGGRVAVITANAADLLSDLFLTVLTLPDQAATPIALTNPQTAANLSNLQGDAVLDIAIAITHQRSLAWSPDGMWLAFVGAQDGASADLYVYSVADGSVTRLTDGPSQAYGVSWSPDGKKIVQAGVSTFGTGAGYGLEGVWSVNADNSGVMFLYAPDSGDEVFLGWLDDNTFLAYSFYASCSTGSLRAVNASTGEQQAIWAASFNENIAFDPVSKAVLFTVDEYVAACSSDRRVGVIALDTLTLSARGVPAEMGQLSWSAEMGVFVIESEGQIQTVDVGGNVVPYPVANADPVLNTATVRPLWSPDRQSALYFDAHGFRVARAPAFEAATITDLLSVYNYPYPLAWVQP